MRTTLNKTNTGLAQRWIAWLAVLGLLLAGCQPGEPSAPPAQESEEIVTVEEDSTEAPLAAAAEGTVENVSLGWCGGVEPDLVGGYPFPTGEEGADGRYYIDGYVLVIFPDDETLGILMASLDSRGIGLAELDRVQATGSAIIGLFQYAGSNSPWPVVRAIVDIRINENLPVYAEPDYFIRPITASKWDWEGSPNNPSPAVQSQNGPTVADFQGQWGLVNQQSGDGQGIELFVLDSSPFSADGGYRLSAYGSDPFDLCVSHPTTGALSMDTAQNPHGLFVAGLTTAPGRESHVHLVRVLNAQGFGETFSLIKTLLAVFDRAATDPKNTVINLSLGIAIDDVLEQEDIDREIITDLTETFADESTREALYEELALEAGAELIPVISLHLILEHAVEQGAVVLAASGNDSERNANIVHPADIPASWPGLIAVGAATPQRTATCYSNAGSIYPPGGAGLPAAPSTQDPCEPRLQACPNPLFVDCRFGVISYVLDQTTLDRFIFGMWAGTSFATPIAAGDAASLLGQGESLQKIMAVLEAAYPPPP